MGVLGGELALFTSCRRGFVPPWLAQVATARWLDGYDYEKSCGRPTCVCLNNSNKFVELWVESIDFARCTRGCFNDGGKFVELWVESIDLARCTRASFNDGGEFVELWVEHVDLAREMAS